MRLTAPSASSAILVLFLAGAGAAFTLCAVAIGACTDPDTQTPSCVPNVDQNGIHAVSMGCEGFPQCDVGNGAAANCCTDADGGALTGNDLATCLYGYGDPSCPYLISSTAGSNVSYMCSTTPPSTGSTGGTGGSGSTGGTGGTSGTGGTGGADGG